jgi:membrane protein required for colicin V production
LKKRPLNQKYGAKTLVSSPDMTVIDFFIIVVLLFFTLQGLFKGFLLEFFGLLAFVLAFFIAARFSYMITSLLDKVALPGYTRNAAAFAIVFIAVYLVIKLMGWLISKKLSEKEKNPLSRLAGGLLGFAKSFLFISIAVFIAETNFPGNKITSPNKLTPYCVKTIHWIEAHTSVKLPKIPGPGKTLSV